MQENDYSSYTNSQKSAAKVLSQTVDETDICEAKQQEGDAVFALDWNEFYPNLKNATQKCLSNYSISKEDLEDIINDSISILYESIEKQKLPAYVKTERDMISYVCSTAKYKTLKFIEQQQRIQSLDRPTAINNHVACLKSDLSTPFVQEMEKICHINFNDRKRAIVMIFAIVYNDQHPLYEQLTQKVNNKDDITLFIEYYSMESDRRYETLANKRAGRILSGDEMTRECNLIRAQVSRLVKRLTKQLRLMQKSFDSNNRSDCSLYQRVYSYFTTKIK